MIKVLAACGAGIGSSMIIKNKIQNVFNSLGIEAEITHASIGSAKSELERYDIIFTLAALAENISVSNSKTMVVGLKNVMSEKEIEAAVKKMLKTNDE